MTGREEELAEVARWAEGIEQVHSCIAGRFRRPEPRRRVLDYLRGLVSSVERKNGWQLAEQAGDATPDGVQRLLYNYRWDADLVSRVNYICRLASISFAGSPPWPGPVAGQHWSGSWGRQTPG